VTLVLGLLTTLLIAGASDLQAELAPWCGETRITGYLRTDFSGLTYDGTPIWTEERITAASWDVVMGSIAEVEGLGRYRVADRGQLGHGTPTPWLDIAVWTSAEAYALTGYRHVCFTRPLLLR